MYYGLLRRRRHCGSFSIATSASNLYLLQLNVTVGPSNTQDPSVSLPRSIHTVVNFVTYPYPNDGGRSWPLIMVISRRLGLRTNVPYIHVVGGGGSGWISGGISRGSPPIDRTKCRKGQPSSAPRPATKATHDSIRLAQHSYTTARTGKGS
jgi:hypothetical protein